MLLRCWLWTSGWRPALSLRRGSSASASRSCTCSSPGPWGSRCPRRLVHCVLQVVALLGLVMGVVTGVSAIAASSLLLLTVFGLPTVGCELWNCLDCNLFHVALCLLHPPHLYCAGLSYNRDICALALYPSPTATTRPSSYTRHLASDVPRTFAAVANALQGATRR